MNRYRPHGTLLVRRQQREETDDLLLVDCGPVRARIAEPDARGRQQGPLRGTGRLLVAAPSAEMTVILNAFADGAVTADY